MTHKRQKWINVGRPRCGEAYTEYSSNKRDFRRSLRNASREYDRRELERIGKLAELHQAGFWKVMNSHKTKSRQTFTQMNFDGNTIHI